MNLIVFKEYVLHKKNGDIQITNDGDIMCTILNKIRGKTAEQLLIENNIDINPPIDLDLLLNNIGISSIGMDFKQVEKQANFETDSMLGAAVSKGENLAIFYRAKDSINRKRFTIAHELAHCCIHTDSLCEDHIMLRKELDNDGIEEKANIFAGELLIPYKILDKIYKKLLMPPSLTDLSALFQVSTNVMEARLKYLKLKYIYDI